MERDKIIEMLHRLKVSTEIVDDTLFVGLDGRLLMVPFWAPDENIADMYLLEARIAQCGLAEQYADEVMRRVGWRVPADPGSGTIASYAADPWALLHASPQVRCEAAYYVTVGFREGAADVS